MKESGFNVYEITDGNDRWMKVSPDAHNYYVAEVNKKHGTAATRAEKALEPKANQDTKAAFDWWRLLYNDKFPTYYL